MESKKANKMRDIVRLKQILKKWRKLANNNNSSPQISSSTNNVKKSNNIQLILKRTLLLSDHKPATSSHDNHPPPTPPPPSAVPKGYVAVSVGEEQRRFVVPTAYLGRRAFRALLREAEEEFGFEQTGVLRIPCDVSVFQTVLTTIDHRRRRADHNRSMSSLLHDDQSWYGIDQDHDDDDDDVMLGYCCCSSETVRSNELGFSHHSSTCR